MSFSGNLAVDGLPVATGPGAVFPYGNTIGSTGGPTDASYFFGTEGQSVNVTANYTGERIQTVATGAAGSAAATDPAYWSRVTNLQSVVNSIDIDLDSYFETSDGGEYDFQLASVDPANIVDNSTALAGRFSGTAGNGAIQFGKLSGTASVSTGYGVTPYPSETGATNTGLLSLYRMAYGVAATVTTNLDENGLTTPRVVVSDGIEMNGSRITGLAAGVSATDAVNKAQLDAATRYVAVNATGAAPTVNGEGAIGIGGNAAASGGNALAIGSQSVVSAEGGVAIGGDSGGDPDSTGARAELYATAIGTDSAASGTAAGAIGAFSRASNSYATAIGFNSAATGTNAVAVGAGSFAARDNSSAIGTNAVATHAGSTAVGAGAQTTAENQLVLGTRATAVVVAGIDASTAAQQGPVDAVTVDANGTLGRQRVASAASVQEVRASLGYISAVTDAQFTDLSNRMGIVETRLNNFDIRMTGIEGGVAAAMAMGQAKLVPDANVSMTVAAATYGGQQGFSGSISGRLADKFYVSGSVSGNTGDSRVGGAVSATFGF